MDVLRIGAQRDLHLMLAARGKKGLIVIIGHGGMHRQHGFAFQVLPRQPLLPGKGIARSHRQDHLFLADDFRIQLLGIHRRSHKSHVQPAILESRDLGASG